MYAIDLAKPQNRTNHTPIGKPVANTQLYILNHNLRPTPIGIPGELHVAGHGLARGYLNQPGLSAEKFIDNPFNPGTKLYRTGDLARWLADGNIEFLGRMDDQIKLRGFRIELGDIESQINSYSVIQNNVVIVHKHNNNKQLIAYYVLKDNQTANAASLKTFLSKRLPDFMIPAAFIELDAIPLTPNGKIDRQKLARLDVELHSTQKYVAPRNGTEKKLVAVWKSVLQKDTIGIHDNFFELGGDSVICIQIVSKARELQLSLTVQKIFQYQTIAALAEKCDQVHRILAEKNISTEPSSLKAPVQAEFQIEPRSHAQSQFPELIGLNEREKGRPVFWFHGGLGGVGFYHIIAEECQRPFYGIQARGWKTARSPLKGIQAMAAYYTHIIQFMQPVGPYDLGGYSLGGTLAYEVARQLQELGQTVNTLVMLDTQDNYPKAESDTSYRTKVLQAVNMELALTMMNNPEKLAETLIHRGKLDLHLDEQAFFNQVIRLAKQRGMKKTVAELKGIIQQMTIVQRAYDVRNFSILPLLDPNSVHCFYFRNKGGLVLGELEPYFLAEEGEPNFDHRNYWNEWQRQLPNFYIMDMDASNHMMLLSEPKVRETILEFCQVLYSEKGISPQFLTAFKKKIKKIHGTMIASGTNNV